MKRTIYISTILLFVIFLSTCSKEEVGNEIINIEAEFDIDLYEQLGESNRGLIFDVSTIETFNCLNYELDCGSQIGESQTSLFIKEIIEPENCSYGMAKANCQSMLQSISEGEHSFRVVIKEAVVNEGKIIKTPTSYVISLESQHGLGTYVQELNIIPNDFVWASVSSNNFTQAAAINMLLSEFVDKFEKPQIEDGYYGYFSIQDQKLVMKNTQQGTYQTTYFFNLADENNLDQLKELSETLREQFEEIELELYTSTGIKF